MSAYEDAGYGARSIGFGDSPAVLVVDFQTAFTDPQYELGRFERIHRAVDNTAALLKVARECEVPVAKCYTAYESERDMPFWKVDALYREFFHGQPSTEIESKVHDPDYDFTFCKSAPSIFFNTPLLTFLIKHRVDTTIITGCTTSGCIRASVVDAFSYGYRVTVPEDCSGDGAEGPHQDNLRDIGRRYADVVSSDEVISYFRSWFHARSVA